VRGVKTELIASAVPTALRKILAPLADAEEHSKWMDVLVKLWISQKPSGINRINKLLASADLTFNAVIAEAAKNRLDEIERVERLAANVEGRRDAFFRELDRRHAFAHALDDICVGAALFGLLPFGGRVSSSRVLVAQMGRLPQAVRLAP